MQALDSYVGQVGRYSLGCTELVAAQIERFYHARRDRESGPASQHFGNWQRYPALKRRHALLLCNNGIDEFIYRVYWVPNAAAKNRMRTPDLLFFLLT